MSYKNARLFAMEIGSNLSKKRRSIRVLADNKVEAGRAAGARPFETIYNLREIKGLERHLEKLSNGTPKEKEITAVFPKISRLLRVNTPLEKAFRLQLSSIKKRSTRYILLKVIESFALGDSLSEAFGKHRSVFSNAFFTMVKSAEKSHEIETVLLRIGHSGEKKAKLLKKLITEMIYPGIVVAMGVVVVTIFTLFFVPQLKSIYDNFGAELPLITQLLSSASDFLRAHPSMFLAPVCALLGIIKTWPKIRRNAFFQAFTYKLPGIGAFLWKKDIVTTLEYLGLMLSSKVTLEESLTMAAEVTGSIQVNRICSAVKADVLGGESLSQAFYKVLPNIGIDGDEIVNAIEIGEQTGDLEQVLNRLVEGFQEELDYQVNNFNKILGPIMTLFLAGIGSFVVASILFPLAKLTTVFIEGAKL